MKKLNLLLAMMLLFTVGAWAQGGGGGAGGGSGSGGGAASGGQSGGHGSSAAGGSSMSSAAPTGSETTSSRTTLEGCVIQQGSDYFIQPTKGKKAMVRLVPQEGQDLSAHVGHTVKVHGNSQVATNDPNAPVAGKKTNITNRDMASAAQGSGVPNAVTTPDQNPPKANDAMAGSGALPQGSEVRGGGQFAVTRIDMVSETCDAKAGKHHDKGMDNSGANNPPE